MGIYKNDYNKKDDEILWELHEIRNCLHKEIKNKPVKKINASAFKKYTKWKERIMRRTHSPR